MMNKTSILFTLLFALLYNVDVFGQNHLNLQEIYLKREDQNISVKALDHDSLASTFIISVKNQVRTHKHEHHTEVVIVLEGTGTMTLESDTFSIKKDDYIFIPQRTIHSVKVRGGEPLKVISIQSPFFEGKDRVFN